MNTWKYFVPVAVLSAGVLMIGGAPISSIVGGIVLAGLMVWRSGRRAPLGPR